tara:strand:+ start:1767 stop:2111 length:345 start_codon:yes stop_codon:yes gene_type:complete
MNIRDQLIALKIPTATVTIKGIDGVVHLRGLSGSERDLWEQHVYSERDAKKGVKNIRASLVVRSLTDEAGVRMFKDSEIDQVGSMPAGVIDSLYEHCQRLSGLGAKDAEEIEKN